MSNIKVLDCTLRDGGYINNWNFGFGNSRKIISELCRSKIEYIEVGFLKDGNYPKDETLFNTIDEINDLVPDDRTSEIVAMIVYGQFDIKKITPKISNTKLEAIRVTFKKNEIETVFDYLEKIKNCGYQLFVNPTNIESYTDSELIDLIEKVNKLRPYGFSIVDTNGVLKENDLLRIYYLVNHNLDTDIALCFHSHNNLQLSFSNAQLLMKTCYKKELIIDSTVFGMGRGAGNLCTELLTGYINDNYFGKYNIIPILKIIDEYINPIFAKIPWGYSVPYYLAAINHCHPNYAKYLVDKQTVSVENINLLLNSIPTEKKSIYNQDLIKQIYLDKYTNTIDDSKTVERIKNILSDKNILLLAPGKSLIKEYDKINKFIAKNNPYIISLNFAPDNFKEDMIFVTNSKRFCNLVNNNSLLVITSNIGGFDITNNILNYSSYINNTKEFDNTVLMLLNLFTKIGIKEVNIAGLDGFSSNAAENYASEILLNTTNYKELIKKNAIIYEQIKIFEKNIKIRFITKSLYCDYPKENKILL